MGLKPEIVVDDTGVVTDAVVEVLAVDDPVATVPKMGLKVRSSWAAVVVAVGLVLNKGFVVGVGLVFKRGLVVEVGLEFNRGLVAEMEDKVGVLLTEVRVFVSEGGDRSDEVVLMPVC